MNNFIIIGDIILDQNIYTTIQNSKLKDYNVEYNLDYKEYKLGGCGNVANNLHYLGADNIYLFSAIGDDNNGKEIEKIVKSLDIHSFIQVVPSYNTTIKQRYYHNNAIVFQHANMINKEKLLNYLFIIDIEKILLQTQINCIIICESEKSSIGILYLYANYSTCKQI